MNKNRIKMSLFKKPKKIALRVFTIESENEKNEVMDVENDSCEVIKAEIKEKKKEKKEKQPPKSSLLSFDDEGKCKLDLLINNEYYFRNGRN